MNNIQTYQFEPEGTLERKMIAIVSKKAESPKKPRGEPGTLTGV